MAAHLDATPESGRAFVRRGLEGPVAMLNLLRFRDVADYTAAPGLAPSAPISGAAAYDRYLAHTRPLLDAIGSEIVVDGAGGLFLIGPPDESWDRVLLVRHRSVEVFLALAGDERYPAGAEHRTAALADSRLLPVDEAR